MDIEDYFFKIHGIKKSIFNSVDGHERSSSVYDCSSVRTQTLRTLCVVAAILYESHDIGTFFVQETVVSSGAENISDETQATNLTTGL